MTDADAQRFTERLLFCSRDGDVFSWTPRPCAYALEALEVKEQRWMRGLDAIVFARLCELAAREVLLRELIFDGFLRLVKLRLGARPCLECGRWNYHLVGCSLAGARRTS